MDFKVILTDIARAIVDNPDAVKVEETVNGDDIELVLTVAEDDTGMVIGRHGRIAKAIRQIMKAAANTCGKHVTVEIKYARIKRRLHRSLLFIFSIEIGK